MSTETGFQRPRFGSAANEDRRELADKLANEKRAAPKLSDTKKINRPEPEELGSPAADPRPTTTPAVIHEPVSVAEQPIPADPQPEPSPQPMMQPPAGATAYDPVAWAETPRPWDPQPQPDPAPDGGVSVPAASSPQAAPAPAEEPDEPAPRKGRRRDRKKDKGASPAPAKPTKTKRGPRTKRDHETGEKLYRYRTDDDTDLYIPYPNRKLRSRSGAARRRLLAGAGVATIALLGGTVLGGVYGLAKMSQRPATLAASEAEKYHLDTYNTAAAAEFGSRYLRTCLVRSNTQNRDADELRERQLTAASIVGDPACRDNKKANRQVVSVLYSGNSTTPANAEAARYLSFAVTFGDGQTRQYSLPIWFADPGKGVGPRVIGSLGIMPAGAFGAPDETNIIPTSTREFDAELASLLREDFLPSFMASWMSSGSDLSQFLAPEASPSARAGLNAFLAKPDIQTVTVAPPASAVDGNKFVYSDGDVVRADVVVSATNTPTGQPDASTWRVWLTRSGGHWFVSDVQGGTVSALKGSKAEVPKADAVTPSPVASSAPAKPAAKKSAATTKTSAKPKS